MFDATRKLLASAVHWWSVPASTPGSAFEFQTKKDASPRIGAEISTAKAPRDVNVERLEDMLLHLEHAPVWPLFDESAIRSFAAKHALAVDHPRLANAAAISNRARLDNMLLLLEQFPESPIYDARRIRAFATEHALTVDEARLTNAAGASNAARLENMLVLLEQSPDDPIYSERDIRLFAAENALTVDEVRLARIGRSQRMRQFGRKFLLAVKAGTFDHDEWENTKENGNSSKS